MGKSLKQSIKNIIRDIRPFKSLHYMLMASLGCYFSRNFQVVTWILCLIAIFLAWQFDFRINDVFDVEIDKIAHADRLLVRDKITRRTYIIILIVILSIIFGISIIIGWISALIIAIYIGLGILYSIPPLRIRQYIIASIFIGATSTIAFFFGYLSLTTIFSGEIFIIGLLIFLGLSMGTVIKDYKDYEGDKAENIRTIFTTFGVEWGLIISYILLLITFLLPIVLIHQIIDIIIIVGSAILTIIVFKLKKNVTHVFLLYFIVLFYSFMRYEGFF
ncbi:MAG: UbiA family prenyltransferase [Candidatus Helarchaeota archaeon]|nr:UbiA family prenyltransferase [Candidatus Helarchaeota archaeon]